MQYYTMAHYIQHLKFSGDDIDMIIYGECFVMLFCFCILSWTWRPQFLDDYGTLEKLNHVDSLDTLDT